MIEDPGRPGTPITGERTNLEVARSAALGLWSCSKSRSNKIVSVCVCVHVAIEMIQECIRMSNLSNNM